MYVLLDTNLIYQLNGFNKNHKNSNKFNLRKLLNDISNCKYEFVVSNYVVSEIVSSTKTDKNKQEILKLLHDMHFKLIYLEKGQNRFCPLDNFINLSKIEYEKLKEVSLKEKIIVESNEIKENFAIIMFYISTCYGYLAETFFRSKGQRSNIIDLTYNVMNDNKKNALKNLEDFFKEFLEEKYLQKDLKKDEVKEKTKKIFFVIVRSWIYDYLEFLSYFSEIKEFIAQEKNILSKNNDNPLEYFGNLNRRILKIKKEDDVINYVIKRTKLYLVKLKYPKAFISYNNNLIKKLLSDGSFEKNDSIDSTNFMFMSDNIYLISEDKKIQEHIKILNPKNYKFIQEYLNKEE